MYYNSGRCCVFSLVCSAHVCLAVLRRRPINSHCTACLAEALVYLAAENTSMKRGACVCHTSGRRTCGDGVIAVGAQRTREVGCRMCWLVSRRDQAVQAPPIAGREVAGAYYLGTSPRNVIRSYPGKAPPPGGTSSARVGRYLGTLYTPHLAKISMLARFTLL